MKICHLCAVLAVPKARDVKLGGPNLKQVHQLPRAVEPS